MATNPETLPATRLQVAATRDRQELAARETSAITETASTAVAAHAKAAIEARYSVALHRPRDIDNVRILLVKECRRPGFARVAKYRVPRGGSQVVGPSIRLAEAALRIMGNVMVETPTLYDDARRRIIRVEVIDLETNASYSLDLAIDKTVERKHLGKGQEPLGQRLNSYGETVYLVEATEDDFATKAAARISKAIRTLGLRLLPGDLLEDAMRQVDATLRDEAAKDPDAERKAIADGFAKLNVAPSHLKQYLGHDLAQCSPAQLVELRELWQALQDGATTWSDIMTERTAPVDAVAEKTNAKADALRTKREPEIAAEKPGAGQCQCERADEGDHEPSCPVSTGAPTGASGKGLFR